MNDFEFFDTNHTINLTGNFPQQFQFKTIIAILIFAQDGWRGRQPRTTISKFYFIINRIIVWGMTMCFGLRPKT